jgi:hypothetical protein
MSTHALLAVPNAIATAKVAIALAAAALLAWEFAARRATGPDRQRRARDAGLALAGAAAALAFFDFRPDRALSAQHGWELYHHYVGAKYFREVGYDRLYRCTVLADHEAGFPIPPERRPVRRLETAEIGWASELLADPDLCRRHFTPARWESFQRDVGFLRERFVPRQWALMLTDHGLNATPLWIAVGGALANAAPASELQLRALALLDPLLLAAAWAAAFWAFGWRPACVALIFWGTAEPCESGWVLGAFLRQDWLATSMIGVALLRRGRPAAGGFALAWATGLRVFPGFLVAALVLRSAVAAVRTHSLRIAPADRRFALGCVAALALALPLSAAGTTGLGSWRDFAHNSRVYLEHPLTNFMGWRTALSFDPSTSARVLRLPSGEDAYREWGQAVRANFERREPLYWAGLAAFVLLLGAAASRASDWVAAILGAGLVVMSVEVASYYYALLLLYGFLSERHPLVGAGLLGLSALTWGIAEHMGFQDETSAVQSAACAAFAFLATAAVWRAGRRAAGATRP